MVFLGLRSCSSKVWMRRMPHLQSARTSTCWRLNLYLVVHFRTKISLAHGAQYDFYEGWWISASVHLGRGWIRNIEFKQALAGVRIAESVTCRILASFLKAINSKADSEPRLANIFQFRLSSHRCCRNNFSQNSRLYSWHQHWQYCIWCWRQPMCPNTPAQVAIYR